MTEPLPSWPERLTLTSQHFGSFTMADVLETIEMRWPFASGTYTTNKGVTVPLAVVPWLCHVFLLPPQESDDERVP